MTTYTHHYFDTNFGLTYEKPPNSVLLLTFIKNCVSVGVIFMVSLVNTLSKLLVSLPLRWNTTETNIVSHYCFLSNATTGHTFLLDHCSDVTPQLTTRTHTELQRRTFSVTAPTIRNSSCRCHTTMLFPLVCHLLILSSLAQCYRPPSATLHYINFKLLLVSLLLLHCESKNRTLDLSLLLWQKWTDFQNSFTWRFLRKHTMYSSRDSCNSPGVCCYTTYGKFKNEKCYQFLLGLFQLIQNT